MEQDAPVISYTLQELHILYRGDGASPSYTTFREWLKKIPDLIIEGRVLTPGQVKAIFDHIGAPTISATSLKQIPRLKK